MSNSKFTLILALAGAGLTLLLAGLLPVVIVHAQETTDEPPVMTPEAEPAAVGTDEAVYETASTSAIEPTGDNSYCMLCHNQQWRSVALADGQILNLYVPPDVIAGSVHGTSSEQGALGCVDCHGDDAFPHSGPSPTDSRQYTLDSVAMCVSCHEDQTGELERGLHAEAIRTGNTAAAVCTDCHGAHNVQSVAVQPGLVAGVCGDCHQTTLAEWQSSAHVDIGPLGCGSCHSPHSQRLRVGETGNDLCLNCHNEMPEVFSHTQHNNSEAVGCTDCHMFVEEMTAADAALVSVSDVPTATGHSMHVETVACNTCHQELVTSGEWTQLAGDSAALRSERDELQARLAELEATSAEAESGVTTSYVQLLQGLILGLGFGITAAAIFIARGNRRG